MKILLAIDSSRGSQVALDEVVARPWPAGTEFTVVHVVDVRNFAHFPAVIEDAERAGANLVKTATEKLAGAGRKCSSEVTIGTPRSSITEFAKDWGADFIIVGSHGHGAIARFLIGSVAQGILRAASCSVEIVRPRASGSAASQQAMKILLATDCSEFSMAAARSVANRPWPAGSQIKIMSVEEIPAFENQTTAFPLAAVYPASLLEELMESARNRASEAVEGVKKVLAGTSLKIVNAGPMQVGDPRLIILEQAQNWPADLIVLGSHGRRGLDRVLLGSVSEAVAIHAQCSVEVIRPTEVIRAQRAK